MLGARGTHHLDEERVEGEDPLAPFGPNAAAHVARTDGFPHCADIMVNSTYWDETDEVAAFEELVRLARRDGRRPVVPVRARPAGLRAPGRADRRGRGRCIA